MTEKTKSNEFAELSKQQRTSLLSDFWQFLKYNKKWWLLPPIIAALLLGALALLSSTAIAPFIYPLF
jgi:hypothetical protein